MSDDEVKALEPEPVEPGPRVEAPAASPTFDADDLKLACTALVEMIGSVVCTRARVDPLTRDECVHVGEALARVAALYDLGASPKFVAWFGLGAALVPVAAPRLEQVRARRVQDAKPKPEPEPEKVAEPVVTGPGTGHPDYDPARAPALAA